jgi:tetrahydromethanopterin S-methyltransferase subunit B
MFNLLAKQQSKADREQETKATDAVDEDAMNQDDAAEDASAHLAVPTPSSADAAFDLSSSPLGLVSSLSSSLLSSARRQVSSAVSVGGDAAKLLHTQVKRGMEKGVEGIERATRTNTVAEGDEKSDADADTKETSDWKESKSDRRRVSWSQMKSANDEFDEQADDDDGGDDDAELSSPTVASSSSPSSSLASSSDLSILRMNFLRLLHRAEETSFAHLHASPGSPGLLHQPRLAKSFARSVNMLQKEFLAEFRRRRAVIQQGKENAEFMRRVAFLATLAEKTTQTQQPIRTERKVNYPTRHATHTTAGVSTALAHGVHSIRTAAALLSAVNSASIAASSSIAAASSSSAPLVYDEGVESLLDRSSPAGVVDRTQEIRALLFSKQAERDNAAASSSSSSTAGPSREFSAEMEQRQLINDLHGMTDSLKANALRMRSALASDAKVLDAVDTQLDHNLHSITHENSRLAKWASTGCSEMFWNILLIITIWSVFIGMFIFMKIFPAPK